MNMEPQVASAANNLSLSPLFAALTTSSQQGSKVGNTPFSKEPFAEMLESLFVDIGNESGAGVSRAISLNPKSGNTILTDDCDNQSTELSHPQDKKSGNEPGGGFDFSNLAILIPGMMQPISPAQPTEKPADPSASTSGSPLSLITKIEQHLAALLTTSQDSIGGSELNASQSNLVLANPLSEGSGSGNDFMSMLSKKAAENPVVKANLLKFLSEAPNSSINRDSSDEVEKILAELSSSGAKSNKANSPTDVSQKFSTNDAQIATILQKPETLADPSVKAPAAGNSSSLSGNRGMESASILRSAANSSDAAAKFSAVHDDQGTTMSGNVTAASDKTDTKVSVVVGKQGSQKSDNDSANLIKQNGAEIYQTVSVDSKIDSRFKQELTTAVENSHDVSFSKPDISQVAQTVIREANMMTQENKTVVNVKLEPESLGSVVLRVASDNGKISAEFNVKTSDAQAYLETSIPQMKQMLQSSGISLSHLSVSLSGGESQTRQQQSPARKNSQKFSMEMDVDSPDMVRTFGYNTIEVKV